MNLLLTDWVTKVKPDMNLLLTDWVTKVKPDMNSIEVHPQQSHIRHPVHDVVVAGAGSLWPFIGTVPT
jgi:hypothetical protein